MELPERREREASEGSEGSGIYVNWRPAAQHHGQLPRQQTGTCKKLWIYVFLKIFVVFFGMGIILAILYFYGRDPWAQEYAQVYYTTTKKFSQTCGVAQPRTIFLPKLQAWGDGCHEAQLALLMREFGQWYGGGDGSNITMDIINWTGPLQTTAADEEVTLQTWREIISSENLADESRFLEDWQIGGEEIGVRIWVKNGTEQRATQCNWIYPEAESPKWYCTSGCTPWPGEERQGFWKNEVVYTAHSKNETCVTILPRNKMFWGYYDLACNAATPPIRRAATRLTRALADEPAPALQVRAPTQRTTVQLVDPAFQPRDRSHHRSRSRELARNCLENKIPVLNPCFWNIFFQCKAQNYMVITPATHLVFYASKGMYGEPRAFHEDWLNETLPWLWIIPLDHFRGAFPEGYARTSQGLGGPVRTDMYVQRLPTPEELLRVPKGDFQKIDECVVGKMFDSLNGTDYVSNGASPRCPLHQSWAGYYGIWTYDCTELRVNMTTKGILQGWRETHARSEGSTWWGLQKQEVIDWVIPCLSQTADYWVKYQYLATVYSKDQDIWPGGWSRPDPYVSPRPWRMVCDSANTTCDVSLARRNCGEVPGWPEYCQQHYNEEYELHGLEVRWIRGGQDGIWRRSVPAQVGCTKAIMGHQMKERKNVNGEIIPQVADPTIFLAEGHAFRKSLCEGTEIRGFEWLGPNRIYNNETCHPPEERWMRCGAGGDEHECRWYEIAGTVVAGAFTTAVTGVMETIGEGASVLGGWMSELIAWMWPYFLMIVGVIIMAAMGCAVVRGGARAVLGSCMGRGFYKRKKEERLLPSRLPGRGLLEL